MATDPLVHYGRHFGRINYAFCNIKTLLTNGLERLANNGDDAGNLSARYASIYDPPKTHLLNLTESVGKTLSFETFSIFAMALKRSLSTPRLKRLG
jgi:hypothetical protein